MKTLDPLIWLSVVMVLSLIPIYYSHSMTTIEESPYTQVIVPEWTPQTPQDYIREVFPRELWQEAEAIMWCESRNIPTAHGDKHLMHYDAEYGEWVGSSIGLFQIRTGGDGWNRARANGMSVDEFKAWMFDPKENVKYAYEIYKRNGWSSWSCEKLALNK